MSKPKPIHLSIVAFDTLDGAQAAASKIREKHAISSTTSAVVVEKDHAGKVNVKDIGLTPAKGAFGGTALGLAVGLLSGGTGVALGALGALLGGVRAKKTSERQISGDVERKIEGLLPPGSSAILIVGDRPLQPERVAEFISMGGKIYTHEISPEEQEELAAHSETAHQALTDEIEQTVQAVAPGGPPYPRVFVIINPAAGGDEPILNAINDVFRRYGVEWEVGITHKYGDAEALARQAAEAGYDLVAGYGGDGTQHEVANGLIGTEAAMGVLPGGTGNGFSRELGLPNKLYPALELLCTSRTVKHVDAVKFRNGYFIQRLYVGIEPEEQTSREMKDKYGTIAYAISGYDRLKNSTDVQYHLTIDGELLEITANKVYVVNASQTGTGISVTGRLSSSEDGVLEIFALSVKDLKTLSAAAERMADLSGKLSQQYFWRGKEIKIETEPDQPVWTDGEYQGRTPVEMKVVPGALRVVAVPEA